MDRKVEEKREGKCNASPQKGKPVVEMPVQTSARQEALHEKRKRRPIKKTN